MPNNLSKIREMALHFMSKKFEFVDLNLVKHEISAKQLGYMFEFELTKSAFGRCHYRAKKITLSSYLYGKNIHLLETDIKDTMLHELAHAFTYHIYGRELGRGHGKEWKHTAKSIGCSAERCRKSEGMDIPLSKYSLVCDSCGKTSRAHRKPQRDSSCGKCDPKKYNPNFKMRLVQNY